MPLNTFPLALGKARHASVPGTNNAPQISPAKFEIKYADQFKKPRAKVVFPKDEDVNLETVQTT